MSRPAFHALAFGPQGGMVAKHGADGASVDLSFDDLPGGLKATGRLEAGEPWARIELARDGRATVLYDGPWSALPLPAGLSAAPPEGALARGAEPPAQAPPPAGPASPLPAAEIGPQAGSQGPEIVVQEEFGGWRWGIRGETAWSLPYATERAAWAGAREAQAAALRLRAAEAKAAELAAEIERLAGHFERLYERESKAGNSWFEYADSCQTARALLARLGFRPGQP